MAKKFGEGEFEDFVVRQFESVVGAIAESRSEFRAGFAKVGERLTSIEEILEPLSRAVDADAETIIAHDKRLTRVETHLGLGETA